MVGANGPTSGGAEATQAGEDGAAAAAAAGEGDKDKENVVPDPAMLSMLRREVLLTRAKLHYLGYQQMMAERMLRSLKAQLRQVRCVRAAPLAGRVRQHACMLLMPATGLPAVAAGGGPGFRGCKWSSSSQAALHDVPAVLSRASRSSTG